MNDPVVFRSVIGNANNFKLKSFGFLVIRFSCVWRSFKTGHSEKSQTKIGLATRICGRKTIRFRYVIDITKL